MEQLSRLLLDLYRAARETSLEEFQDAALALIKPLLHFDSSMWGSGPKTPRGVAINHVHLYNEPPEMVRAFEEVTHQDHAAAAMMRRKSAVGRFNAGTLFSGRDKRDIRNYTRRFKHENNLIAGTTSDKDGFVRWVSLYRASADHQYTVDEGRLCGLLVPHLFEALAINRVAQLEQLDFGAQAHQHSLAIADRRGILYHTDAGFARVLREEYPTFSGQSLPDLLVSALLWQGRHVGHTAAFTARIADDLLFMKARPRVAADGLSPRELAVAREIRRGSTHKEIARTIGIAPATARNHIQAIHEKLQVGTKAEIIAQLRLAD